MQDLVFRQEMLCRPKPGPWDVETTLAHFAIITYLVNPSALRQLVDERFELDVLVADDGTEKALISVVPFMDMDFRFNCYSWPRWSFGQTNYRAYVCDRKTGEHVVWFFGTSLASRSVAVPRYLWNLPWYGATITFDSEFDEQQMRYTKYRMTTNSKWAPAEISIDDTGEVPQRLEGFQKMEAGEVLLTHPLKGYYYRRDGALGSYSVWHPRIEATVGRVNSAKFPLLDRLGLVREGDTGSIHSVLLQRSIDFTIYLPPRRIH